MTGERRDLLRATFPDRIREELGRYPSDRPASATIALLYLAQAAYGHMTASAVEEVAELVCVDPSRVRALVGFYSLLRRAPTGGWLIHVCTDLPCALRGADAFLDRLCSRLGIAPGETTADGLFTVEEAMCLAACDRAPVMQVNLAYADGLDDEALDAILDDLRSRADRGDMGRPPLGFGPAFEIDPTCPDDERG